MFFFFQFTNRVTSAKTNGKIAGFIKGQTCARQNILHKNEHRAKSNMGLKKMLFKKKLQIIATVFKIPLQQKLIESRMHYHKYEMKQR